IKVKVPTHDNRHKNNMVEQEREVHKVQILDPAAGTGTFLAEVINQIYSKFEGQKGIWPSYVENHLIPRLNGFELLMASYAMAHLKLDLLLRETGYMRESDQRFRVFLTNSLEEHHPDTGTLFASWLSEEANQANHVKRDTPVMVVMGNPPYSGISSNMGDWITGLIEDYKYVDGEHFGERKHWLHDDYVKFIRYGQHFVDKNGEGVLAYINNHGFLDNPTFRGMRWNLLKTFDKIFVIDLHGNTMKNETPPDGQKDENVFDIQQGVSINIFIKNNNSDSDSLARVFHSNLWGRRKVKYQELWENSISDIEFEEIKPTEPFYFFVPLDYSIAASYNQGFSLEKFFEENVTGIVTARDSLVIDSRRDKLLERMDTFSNLEISDSEIRNTFFKSRKGGKYPPGDSRGWKLPKARKSISQNEHSKYLKKIHYRPFDLRFIYYSPDMVDWGRENLMPEVFHDNNLGIVFPRQAVTDNWSHIQVTNHLIDNRLHYSNKGIPLFAPLYIHSDSGAQQTLDGKPDRKPNLDADIVQKIADGLGLRFVPEKENNRQSDIEDGVHLEGGPHLKTFAPIDLLDFIYAVLHSPTYREKYKEFLKIDFPRVPYPEGADTFWHLVELGGELRQIHLLEHPIVNDFITTYPKEGNNKITKRLTKTDPGFIPYTKDGVHLEGGPHLNATSTNEKHRYPNEKLGKVQINKTQYFGMVPEKAWNFYIGGYQPAEKWLKDRRDRELSFEEIQHYQKVIVALMETDRIMGEIDEIEIET
ncbi:MAG TPA: type ISP restriction/modification enzyme, partial [Balneolaceae bacterium]|nr:type ISP restriction/modification enzyme [Balneolaceae bacterium]